jgi:hypothetical protein
MADESVRYMLNDAVALIELAYQRLSSHHLTQAVTLAEIYTPLAAVEVGFLDRLVPASAVVGEAC